MKRLFLENKRLQKEKEEWKARAEASETENADLKEDLQKVKEEIREELNALRLKLEEIIEEAKKATTKEERAEK